MKKIVLMIIILCLTIPAVAEVSPDELTKDKPDKDVGEVISLVKFVSDNNSNITQPRYYRIESVDYWEEVWRDHSDEEVPDIDFEKHMIVALFLGQRVNTTHIEVEQIKRFNNRIKLKYKVATFSRVGEPSLSFPFGIFVLPKSNHKIVLKQDLNSYFSGPSNWTKDHKLKQGDRLLEGPESEVLTLEEYKEQDEEARQKVMNLFQ